MLFCVLAYWRFRTRMAYNILLCLLLIVSSFQHVTSFNVHRRHSRNSGLADALRMLERQRRRIDNEEHLAASSPHLFNEDPAQEAEAESFLPHSASSSSPHEISPAWISKTLGPESTSLIEQSPEDLEVGEFWDEPVVPSSAEIEPAFQDQNDDEELEAPPRVNKKDKEIMMNVVGDARPKVQTRSSTVMDSDAADDISVGRDEFNALVEAVERIQEEAMEKAEEEEEEEEEVMEEVQEKIAQARAEAREETAKEEEEAAILRANPLLEEEAAEEEEEEDNDLNDLFEEDSEEVIPTENGEVVKVERTVKNWAGEPLEQEQAVEQVEDFPGHSPLFSPDDLWYMKNYRDDDNRRRKRTSIRNPFSSSLTRELPARHQLTSELIQAYVTRIRELEVDLDQAQMQTYLEDLENDLLTDALHQATMGQTNPSHLPLRELHALRDAIRVEEMLQDVKADRMLATDLARKLEDEVSGFLGKSENQKRGEPWRKRNDAMLPEIPVFVMGGDDGEGPDDGSTALALQDQSDDDDEENAEDPFVPFSEEDVDQEVDRADDDLIGQSFRSRPRIASLFSDDADQCPAVQAFSTNCHFAGHNIDYEARALCNLHEMCYICGRTLEMQQGQCDFIYQAASSMLCGSDPDCALDSRLFLNAMKLKHRFVSYLQPLCRAPCTARFLSII